MNCNFLIFGGTTEGRLLAERLSSRNIPHAVSVATKYGEEIELKEGESNLFVGRMTSEEMADCILKGAFTHVIDATHPFAVDASKEIADACNIADVPCCRLSRDTKATGSQVSSLVYVDNLSEAADKINQTNGTVLFLTGSRDLSALISLIKDPSRVYVRVLPNVESLAKCHEAGISGKQIIAMQGPFSKEMNAALIRQIGAKLILTKESGRVGGLNEKLEAACECGAAAVVIRNPEQRMNSGVQSLDMEGILKKIASITGDAEPAVCSDIDDQVSGADIKEACVKRQIIIAGVGPGDGRYYVKELDDALRKADIIFGAKSVVDRLPKNVTSRVRTVELYRAEEILKELEANTAFRNPLVVYSGDISLCSGAKTAAALFEADGYRVKKISGISSVSLLANRLGIALEETVVVSSHGRNCNVTGHALRNEKTIVLTGGSADAAAICGRIPGYMKVIAGCDLGTEQEKIFEVSEGCSFTNKTLLYIENSMAAGTPVYPGLSDDEFIRGEVPMTKEEIRAFSIRKLRLHKKAVLYDIGAGTGSVSIESALSGPDIQVYAIERNPKALELLRLNREKFHADNVYIIEGTAPEAIRGIPAPTHVFIGGSSGGMRQIVERVRGLNDKARIVINCITPETLSDVITVAKELQLPDPEIVQITAGRYRKTGNYHLPQMMNPVYVISF